MTPVLQHLKSQGIELPAVHESDNQWVFAKNLYLKPIDFFRGLARNHDVINLEYQVLCAQLIHLFSEDTFDKSQHVEKIKTALMLAELLCHLYKHYLVVPREVIHLQHEQALYRTLLAEEGYQFPHHPAPEKLKQRSLTKSVREGTNPVNISRQFIGRFKKVLTTIDPAARNASYHNQIAILNRYATPPIVYAAWLIYIPRLSINIWLLTKHIFPGRWMGEEERKLGWKTRLNAQLKRRWFEVANDSIWLAASMTLCFALMGSLSLVGLYVSVGLYTVDVVLTGLRAFFTANRLNALVKQYQEMLEKASPEQQEAINDYLIHLKQRIKHEKKQFFLSFTSASILSLAALCTIPIALTLTPFLPLIGALLILTISAMCFTLGKHFAKQKPETQLVDSKGKSKLATIGFFKPEAKEQNQNTEIETQHRTSPLYPILSSSQ